MSAQRQVLYTREMLALAVSLAQWPMRAEFTHQADMRAQSCGSVVRVGLDRDVAGGVAAFGVDARACALGQASAAILAAQIVGQSPASIAEARDLLTAFLAGERPDPGDWPGIEVLATALPYPARHGSILLPWRAAVMALER